MLGEWKGVRFFSAQDLHMDTGRTKCTVFVWNVAPAFQHRLLNSIHLRFSVTTRSLAALTDPHSCLYCAGRVGFFWNKTPKVIHRGCCLTYNGR